MEKGTRRIITGKVTDVIAGLRRMNIDSIVRKRPPLSIFGAPSVFIFDAKKKEITKSH